MFKLVIADDDGNQTVVPVVREEISIGRRDGNTIRLTERNVSRNHGRLTKHNGSLFYEEVSARYGTLVNGEKLRTGPVEIRLGDIFTIGDYRLFLQNPDGTVPEAVQAQLKAQSGEQPVPEQPRDATEVLSMQPRPVPAASSEPAKLCVMNTSMAGTEFALLGDSNVIGRTDENDIFVDHRSISRHHAKIERVNNVYRVTDMGSANGIKVNGERYQTIDLRRGDILQLGTLNFRFVAPGEMWTFTPGAATDDYADVGDEKSGGLGKLIAIMVVILLVVGGGLAVMMSGGDDDDGDSSSAASTTPGTDDNEAPSNDEQTPNVAAAEYQNQMLQGRALMEEQRWDDAINVFSQIPQGAPQYAEADQLAVRARAERQNLETYQRVVAAEQASNYAEAFSTLAQLPEDSHYRRQAESENIRERMREAWGQQAIAACQPSLEARNFDEARGALEPVMQVFPEDPALVQQLAAINAAEAAHLAALQEEEEEEEEERRPRPQEEEEEEEERQPRPDEEEEEEEEEPAQLSSAERRERASDLIREARRAGIRGDHEGAIDLLEEAQDLNASESRIYLMLYTNHSRISGHDRQAARALREYLRREPNDSNAIQYREIIERLEGN